MGRLTSSPIGAFAAKTHFSRLIRETARGKSFTVFRRGREVARLVPPGERASEFDAAKLLAGFRSIRETVKGRLALRRLIAAGRRH